MCHTQMKILLPSTCLSALMLVTGIPHSQCAEGNRESGVTPTRAPPSHATHVATGLRLKGSEFPCPCV